MKKLMFFFLMALMVTSVQAITTSSNLLTNPGAEDGDMTGWTATSGIAAVTSQAQGWGTTEPLSGSYFFSMHEATLAPASMSQQIDLTGLLGVLVSFDASCWLQTQADSGELEVVFKDGSGAVVGTYSTGVISNDGTDYEYAEFTLSDVVPANAEVAICTLYGYLDSGEKVNAMYDDVSLTVDQVASIEKVMDDEGDDGEGDLGETITVTLTVDNPYDDPVTVVDEIPDGLAYIPLTLLVGGFAPAEDPEGNIITATVPKGTTVITFDVQVVEVQYNEVDVTNTAYVYAPGVAPAPNDEDYFASALIELNPYEGFDKVVGMCTEPDSLYVPWHTDVHWLLRIDLENIAGDYIETMGTPVVTDNLSGALEMHLPLEEGKVFVQWPSPLPGIKKEKGKSDKLHLIWDAYQDPPLGNLTDGVSQPLWLEVSTDVNPGHGKKKDAGGDYKNEFTSLEDHELNSGATLKFIDVGGTGFQFSAHTAPITVEVYDPDA